MGSILAMAAIIVVTVSLAITTMYVLYKVLTNFPPGKSRMQNDLNKLKAEIAPWFSELVPWNEQEMEKLSLNQVDNKVKKGIVTTGKGIFTSIYHEPMIAYAFKKYVGGGNHALLYARTSHHEYAFRIKNKETEVWMDGNHIGKIRGDGTMIGVRGNKLLAKITQKKEELLLPVIVNGKEVASLVNPEKAGRVNPRAFEFLRPMKPDEEAVFLSMTIMEMAKQELDK